MHQSPFQEGFNQHWLSRKLFKVNFKDRPEFFPDWLSWETGGCGFKILILPTINFDHSLSSTPPPHRLFTDSCSFSLFPLHLNLFSPSFISPCVASEVFFHKRELPASSSAQREGVFLCSNIAKWVSSAKEQLSGRAEMWREKRWKKFQVKFSISQFWAKQE